MGFLAGNIDMPYYLTGSHPVGGAPAGSEATANGDNKVFADEEFVIEKDTRPGSKGYRITDRSTGGTVLTLEMDLETRQVALTGEVGIRIATTGAIRIFGGSVSINNRLVRPGGEAI